MKEMTDLQQRIDSLKGRDNYQMEIGCNKMADILAEDLQILQHEREGEREDFEFDMAIFWNEEEEFNKQGLFDKKLRIVTLFQSI
jgi:hypothetical protein